MFVCSKPMYHSDGTFSKQWIKNVWPSMASSILTLQNSPHPVVSSCYSFEGLGLADLQTLGSHEWAVSASFASSLHHYLCLLHPLGPWRAHPPGPGSRQLTQCRSCRWKRRVWHQSQSRGDGGRGRWKLVHLWQRKSSTGSRRQLYSSSDSDQSKTHAAHTKGLGTNDKESVTSSTETTKSPPALSSVHLPPSHCSAAPGICPETHSADLLPATSDWDHYSLWLVWTNTEF